jgi:SNF2 family DNA or RNA helicase
MGYRRERLIERKVRDHSVAVNAEDAGLANVQFFESISVQLPAKATRMYLQLVAEFMTEWEGGLISAANAGVKRLRLLQLCGGFTTSGQQIHSAKVDALRAYLTLLHEQGESVVVYSRFTPEVEAAYNVLEKVGYRAFRVDGSISRKDRGVATQALAGRPSTPTGIAFQHQAGSRAIELVGAAETVYYSPPDGWVDYYQTLKRTQGPNQKRPVRYTHLVVPGTVDISVIRNLQAREDGHAHLMQNPRRYLRGMI